MMDDNIILHPKTKIQIEPLISKKSSQAIGIVGRKGSGRGFLAKYIASKMLNLDSTENYPYILNLDGSDKDTGIEQIREIRKFLSLKVPSSNLINRIIIIESIELLSVSAQNALLKTIEEPPAETAIIITSATKSKVLPTIVSRVQWISALPATVETLIKNFESRLSPEEAAKLFKISEGNIADFYRLANAETDTDSSIIAINEAKRLLGLSRFERIASVDGLIKQDSFTLQ